MEQREKSDLFIFASLVLVGAVVMGFGWVSRAKEIQTIRSELTELQDRVARGAARDDDSDQVPTSKSDAGKIAAIQASIDATQSTANHALAASQAAQAGVNDLNEKMDRMFSRLSERK